MSTRLDGPVVRRAELAPAAEGGKALLGSLPDVAVAPLLARCARSELPKIADPRGNLTFIEGRAHVPFDILRVYYVYDVPGGAERGGHAHRLLHEFVVAMSGSFDVVLDDGLERQRVHLNRSYNGLYICPMVWRELDNFSSNSVCLVLASARYDESDYLRDYERYMEVRACGR